MPTVFASFTFVGLQYAGGANGGNLLVGEAPGYSSSILALDTWVLPSGNEIDVTLSPLPGHQGAAAFAVEGRPDSTGEGDALFRFEWRCEAGLVEPVRLRLPFEPARVPPSRLWPKARQFTALGDAERAAITKEATALVEAFRRRDLDAILGRHFGARTEDMARALGADARKYSASTKKAHEEMLAESAVVAVSPENLRFELVAGGRAIRVTDGGRELVRSEDAAIDVHYALVDGEWLVIR